MGAGSSLLRYNLHTVKMTSPSGSDGKNLPAVQEAQGQSLSPEDPPEMEWLPTPVFFPGEFHRQRSLVGYSLWGRSESEG